jgi:hypothetical protein
VIKISRVKRLTSRRKDKVVGMVKRKTNFFDDVCDEGVGRRRPLRQNDETVGSRSIPSSLGSMVSSCVVELGIVLPDTATHPSNNDPVV